LIRPSYVLGVRNENRNQQARARGERCKFIKTIPGNKLLLDHYLDGAIEAEADAICDGENVHHWYHGAYRTLWSTLRR
jgi:carbamoyl-phosphate synthase large subunit